MENEKIFVIITTGMDNAEKITLPFVVATAAQTMDVEVSICLQSDAVMLAKKGEAEKVHAKGLMPLKDLVDSYLDSGGKLLLCSPCIKERNVNTSDLLEGSELIAAGTVVDEILSAKSVINY
jgi:uncharacterized protein involved in oxidation of intracellular sulfur